MTITRYVRAFFQALAMTLRGEKPPAAPYSAIQEWAVSTIALVDRIVEQADTAGLSQSSRQHLTFTIDRRPINFDTALQIIRQHAASEYPYLLKHHNQYSLMTIQATNLNDQYLAQQLVDLESVPQEVRALLSRMSDHLQALPTANMSSNT
ncbi:MAG: hypothetical protein KC519_07165 [Anaerolineae bacterium]|nr:hypothetical protein [Anaerolineae bacterium]